MKGQDIKNKQNISELDISVNRKRHKVNFKSRDSFLKSQKINTI